MMYHNLFKSLIMNRPTRYPRRFFSFTLAVINTILAFILIEKITVIGSLNAATPAELNRFFIKAARKAQPSVVNIIIYQVRTKNREKYYSKVGYGSGTIITKSGYVITNYHVVKKGNFYQITLNDGTECEVQKIKNGKYYIGDVKTDIALLKIDESDILQSWRHVEDEIVAIQVGHVAQAGAFHDNLCALQGLAGIFVSHRPFDLGSVYLGKRRHGP